MNFSVKMNNIELNPKHYNWDIDNKTFSCELNGITLDFSKMNFVSFHLKNNCTIKAGHDCTFNTGSHCVFNTDCDCVFSTDDYCVFNTGDKCTFSTFSVCVFNTGHKCVFYTLWNCTFNTGDKCVFKTDACCTLKRVITVHLIFLSHLSIIGMVFLMMTKMLMLMLIGINLIRG